MTGPWDLPAGAARLPGHTRPRPWWSAQHPAGLTEGRRAAAARGAGRRPVSGACDDGGRAAGEPGHRSSPQPRGALDLPGPAGGRGGGMVRPVPGPDGGTRGHLSAGSAAARAVGEGPRGPGAGGEGLPREPGNPAGGPRPRPHAVLAEVVLSLHPPGPGSAGPPGWRPVRKRRRVSRFLLASGQIVARAPGPGQEPGCEVELTEVHTGGQDWWPLGFEATGPAHLLRRALQATAALVFAHAVPGVELGPDESRSYAQWIGQRPGAGSDAGP